MRSVSMSSARNNRNPCSISLGVGCGAGLPATFSRQRSITSLRFASRNSCNMDRAHSSLANPGAGGCGQLILSPGIVCSVTHSGRSGMSC